ncbi:MAG: DedA family protein [Ignavibacteria bacterium]|nr:DedA family protein [Ignavibacteria bacterium]
MEDLIHALSTLNPVWIYFAVLAIAYLENIFPPFPSDVMIVAAGSFVGFSRVDFLTLWIFATVGSTLGFVSMFLIGHWFGDKILEEGKIKFIPLDQLHKAEGWFRKHGYALIVANRFLAGTRAIVSFFAGLSELVLWKTTVLSFLSSLIWNLILIYAGKALGDSWKEVPYYLEAYSTFVTTVILVIVLLLVAKYIYSRRSTNGNRGSDATSKGQKPDR